MVAAKVAIYGRLTVTRNLMGTMIGWYCLNGGGTKVLAAVRIDEGPRHASQRRDEFRHRRFGCIDAHPLAVNLLLRTPAQHHSIATTSPLISGRRNAGSSAFL